MRATWKIYLTSALIACVVAVATTLVTARLLGLPAGQPLGKSALPAEQSSTTMTQEGVEEILMGRKLEVFYKTPFAGPPNLTFPDGLYQYSCEISEQKAGSFVLRRAGATTRDEPTVAKVKWKAAGQPVK